ncbi:hypothetical protein AB0K09_03480 [Streptomyces sp. NPDC049577]|uniref:hypothetical protein n=1 Tax=Streptomyces sp. NPDC049577 TaxID=3155153 RepID=UPI00341E1A96
MTTAAAPTHVLAWFPGDLLMDDAEKSCWELFTVQEWENNSLGEWLPGVLTRETSLAALRAWVEAELGRRVLELRIDTWRAALPTPTGEPGPWHVYPAYKIIVEPGADEEGEIAFEAAAGGEDGDADTPQPEHVPDKSRRAEALLQRLHDYVGDEHWNRWPAAHREAFGAAMADMTTNPDRTLSFGPDTPVPAWVRREFDGRMYRSECPSLALASTWEPRDWARLLADHPEMRLTNHYYAAPDPQAILAAHELLRERGLEPWFDVELELNLVDGQIVPEVGTGALYTPYTLSGDVQAEVSALLGDGAVLVLDTPTPRGEGMNGWEWW